MWDDKSKSLELSAYIFMILAHQDSLQRTKMGGGIVPIILQVTLLGSPLAQKRALKVIAMVQRRELNEDGTSFGATIKKIILWFINKPRERE
ncbi:hypothetical protein Hanom_Chr16g01447451 [Helianthus anomalus]